MSATRTIFALALVFFASITLVIPRFPPAPLMHEYVEIAQTTIAIWEISITTLLNGIINGLFWAIFTAITYGLAQLTLPTRKPEPLPPMPFAPYFAKPVLENPLVDSNLNLITRASASTRRKQTKRLIGKKAGSIKVARPKTRIRTKSTRFGSRVNAL
jgi:hypothetical protein